MTIHYHGTPITPRPVLHELARRHFCVSFADPRDAETCHKIGQSVMLDNGAFTYWKRNQIQNTRREWQPFYRWAHEWLAFPTTWAVIPDVINGSESDNDHLICEWFAEMKSFKQAAPVWHLHESFERLQRLTRSFDRVCFGSSGDYATVGNDRWKSRMNQAFNLICSGTGRVPTWIHMLRGMSLSGGPYPFSSVDSSDIARNHEQVPGAAVRMADRWDALQCPAAWVQQPVQELLAMESQ